MTPVSSRNENFLRKWKFFPHRSHRFADVVLPTLELKSVGVFYIDVFHKLPLNTEKGTQHVML